MAIAFEDLNIMAGSARAFDQKELTETDRKVFDRDFDLLVEKLSKVDAELGENLGAEKEFYLGVCQVAKSFFNEKPFGGLKCVTGQYGMVILSPQNLVDNSNAAFFYDWTQTVSANTEADVIGGSGTECYARPTAEYREVIAFHTLISYKPDPKLILVEFNVNDVGYTPYNVEPFSKITKADKLFKLIPMPGRVVIHPGGKFYIKGWFDLGVGESSPSATNVDVEIAPFGLCFAEYAQIAAANLT